MKKSLLSLMGIAALSAIFVGIVNAQLYIDSLFSEWAPKVDTAYTQVLNNYDSDWWYAENDLIEGNIRNWELHLTSPIIQDIGFEDAYAYYLFISPYRVEKIKAWDSSVDNSKIIMQEVEMTAGVSNIEFIVWDGLDLEQTYYGFISPIDMYDVFWAPSDEICFKLSTNTYNRWKEWWDAFEVVMDPSSDEPEPQNDEPTPVEQHNAACIGMNMANVTHVINGDTITLKWTAVDGDVVQVAIFDPNEEYWKSLGAVSMRDEKFTYKMQWNWEQNFMLTNGCGEVRYKADAAIKTPEPEVVPPATGPAENVLYIAIAAIILYGAYVLFFRKSEN